MARYRNNVVPFRKPFRAAPLRVVKNGNIARRQTADGWGAAFAATRPYLLALVLAALVGLNLMRTISATLPAAAAQPPATRLFADFQDERVEADFSLCDAMFAGSACVVDGDTFRLGERRVRVVGIDTAERNARCAKEAELARDSTLALQDWLNRGSFAMAIENHDARDRYGRELRTIVRQNADGSTDRLADWMRQNGGARAYGGGLRDGWC